MTTRAPHDVHSLPGPGRWRRARPRWAARRGCYRSAAWPTCWAGRRARRWWPSATAAACWPPGRPRAGGGGRGSGSSPLRPCGRWRRRSLCARWPRTCRRAAAARLQALYTKAQLAAHAHGLGMRARRAPALAHRRPLCDNAPDALRWTSSRSLAGAACTPPGHPQTCKAFSLACLDLSAEQGLASLCSRPVRCGRDPSGGCRARSACRSRLIRPVKIPTGFITL
jgi:hypothetical protein